MVDNAVYGFIRLVDEPTKCYYISSETVEHVLGLKIDDTLNIQGLGRLTIIEIDHQVYNDEYHDKTVHHVYDIVCRWYSDAWRGVTWAI